jgi:hypothetical protein
MKPYYRLFAFALLMPFYALAQTEYVPGVVVNLSGDTLRGEINYKDWDNNPKNIQFKNAEGKVLKLGTGDIKYFGLTTSRLAEYQRYIGPVSMNPIDIGHLYQMRDTSVKFDTVFLRVLQKGKNVTLLTLSDNFKTRFFIEETPSTDAKELIFRVYLSDEVSNGSNRTVYENTYQRQLYALAQKFNVATDKLAGTIEKSEYREDYMLDIAGQINNVSAADMKKNNPTKSKPISIFIAVAAGVLIIIGLIAEFAGHHHN